MGISLLRSGLCQDAGAAKKCAQRAYRENRMKRRRMLRFQNPCSRFAGSARLYLFFELAWATMFAKNIIHGVPDTQFAQRTASSSVLVSSPDGPSCRKTSED